MKFIIKFFDKLFELNGKAWDFITTKLTKIFVARWKENIKLTADFTCLIVFFMVLIISVIAGAAATTGQQNHLSENAEARHYDKFFATSEKTTCIIKMKPDPFETERAWIRCSKWWKAHQAAEQLAYPDKSKTKSKWWRIN